MSLGSSLSPFTRPSSISAQREDSQHPPLHTSPPPSTVLQSHLGQSTQPSAVGEGNAQGPCRWGASLVLFELGPASCSGDRANAKSNKLSMQAESTRCPREHIAIPAGGAQAGGGIATPVWLSGGADSRTSKSHGQVSHAKDGSCFSSKPPRVYILLFGNV